MEIDSRVLEVGKVELADVIIYKGKIFIDGITTFLKKNFKLWYLESDFYDYDFEWDHSYIRVFKMIVTVNSGNISFLALFFKTVKLK